MGIVRLLEKHRELAMEAIAMRKKSPLSDDARLQYATLEKEIYGIEAQICSAAKSLCDDSASDCSAVTGAFADALNAAACNGTSVESVIFGKDSIIDPATASCSLDLVRIDGNLRVAGGELRGQSLKLPWLIVKVDIDGVDGEPVWERSRGLMLSEASIMELPCLQGSVGGRYFLDGSLQREMLAFFRREYARQQESPCRVSREGQTP